MILLYTLKSLCANHYTHCSLLTVWIPYPVRGSVPGRDMIFVSSPKTSKPVLNPHLHGLKRLSREANYFCPSGAEV